MDQVKHCEHFSDEQVSEHGQCKTICITQSLIGIYIAYASLS